MTTTPTKITINTKGSIRVEGTFELYDGEGNKIDTGDRTKISLCKCTKSKQMPFCDGSHKECGTKTDGTCS